MPWENFANNIFKSLALCKYHERHTDRPGYEEAMLITNICLPLGLTL